MMKLILLLSLPLLAGSIGCEKTIHEVNAAPMTPTANSSSVVVVASGEIS